MTNYGRVKRKCHKCKKSCSVVCLVSTNAFGSSDLDCRPPPMRRNTMDAWIERCEHCGYCAPNIENENGITLEFIESNEYQQILHNDKLPQLCISFLCWARCAEELHQYGEATMAYVNAAWVCDDHFSPNSEESIEQRQKAIDSLEKAHKNDQKAISEPKNDELLLLDLYRRTGQFDLCIQSARENFDLNEKDIYEEIAAYQIKLSENNDRNVHKVSET